MDEVNVKDELALDTFKTAKESHLKLDEKLCRRCRARPCLFVCPAGVYTRDEKGEMQIEFEACLECGTCLIACPLEAVQWDYPLGGFGVQFKYG